MATVSGLLAKPKRFFSQWHQSRRDTKLKFGSGIVSDRKKKNICFIAKFLSWLYIRKRAHVAIGIQGLKDARLRNKNGNM